MDVSSPSSPVPGGVEVAPGVYVTADALRFQFSRSSGPGGQNVNKLNTRAELWVPLRALHGLRPRAVDRLRQLAGSALTLADELHLVAQTTRTQEGNRQAVMDRLRELLVRAMREPKVRRQTRPSRSSQRRRLDEKKRRGETKARRRSLE